MHFVLSEVVTMRLRCATREPNPKNALLQMKHYFFIAINFIVFYAARIASTHSYSSFARYSFHRIISEEK